MRMALVVLACLAIVIAGLFLLNTGYSMRDPAVPEFSAETLEDVLAERESQFDDIRPGVEARVIWADAPGERTDIVLLYLHGFSASSEEIRPVPDIVADNLGANLIFWRLPGHGRSGAAMAEPLPQDWIDSTAEAIAAAHAIGDRVIVMGTSTGGTLAARAAAIPELAEVIDGIVFVSPNFRLASWQETLLTLPLSRHWIPLVAGEEREFEPRSEDHAAYWTSRYPTIAAVRLAWLMRDVRGLDFSGITVPALFVFSDADQVVDAAETRRVAQMWGAPATLSPRDVGPGDDSQSHVIAGDILSPGMTQSTAKEVTDWINAL